VITIRGLRKSYGDHVVLDGLDLDAAEGGVYALLGPNGAGKTTTVEILTTYIRADAGTARVAGRDVATEAADVRRVIGVTGQFSAVDPLLTGEENLRMMADLWHLPRATGRERTAALLEQFDLTDAARKPLSQFSGGMRRKLDLAMTLVARPAVIFLDEPTTGLDPRSRRAMWDVVRELTTSGVTIFLTTQYLEEADELATRIGVLDGGRLVAEGTAAQLKARVPGGHVRLEFADPADRERAAVAVGGVRDVEGCALDVPADGGVAALRDLLARLDAAGVEPATLAVHTPDLDDVFLALTGRPAKEEVSA